MPASYRIILARMSLYACFAIGALGAAGALHYALLYKIEVANPLRHEYQLGVAIAVAYAGAFWLAEPLIAFAARRRLNSLERLAAYEPLAAGAAALVLAG